MAEEAVAVERLSVTIGRRLVVTDVTFEAGVGEIYALLGRKGAGKTSLLECLAVERKPSQGTVRLFGRDARSQRRKVRSFVSWVRPDRAGVISDDAVRKATAGAARLLLWDDFASPPGGDRGALAEEIRRAARGGAAVILATDEAGAVEGFADRIGVLCRSRLVLNASRDAIARRFRRIRYQNEITPTRTDFGTELDAFDAVRVRVRGWGSEAIVSNFSEEAFDRFRAIDGVVGAGHDALTLQEVFDATAPPEARTQSGAPSG